MPTSELRSRLTLIKDRIGEASDRAGRESSAVALLAVTKGHPASILRAVAECGLERIGENRVLEAEAKLEECGRLGLQWHLVGHLQRNKAARAVSVFDVFESVDSVRLAEKLAAVQAAGEPAALQILVQVNTSGEQAKSGFDEGAACDRVAAIAALPGLTVRGLMTMAPLTDDKAILRDTFRRARRLFERCADEVGEFRAEVLSMGMSNDFEIAIEEGSTEVRLGTALLGERKVK